MSDERLFAQLAATLHREAAVLASVLHTRGATPRKRGARMLIAAGHCALSIGGGLAEVRVVGAARALLLSG
ncbi:MAG: xanthine dehydrogenase, partial [Lysobacterales bacterium CG_4_10_14_3_um_filter_64_11]